MPTGDTNGFTVLALLRHPNLFVEPPLETSCLLCIAKHDLPSGRQGKRTALLAAVKKFDAERPFEVFDSLRKRRLGKVTLLCRPGERPSDDDGPEDAQLIE